MNLREKHYNELDAIDGYSMIGEAVQILFSQAGGYLRALRWAQEALEEGNVEQAKLSINNALAEIQGGSGLHANIENLGYLLEVCAPRHSTEEAHSYG